VLEKQEDKKETLDEDITGKITSFCKELPADLYDDCVATELERTDESPADNKGKTKN